MNTGPQGSPTKAKSPAKKKFELKRFITSPQSYKVATKLVKPDYLEDLTKLPNDLKEKIQSTISEIYSHIILRRPAEGEGSFFHHVVGTALYEAFFDIRIQGKDHQKKAAGIYNKLKNTLDSITRWLSNPRLSAEQREISMNYQAVLIKHHNIFVKGFKQLSPLIQVHIKQHANIDTHVIQETMLSPRKRKRVDEMHPTTPSPKKPLAQKITPKKLSAQDTASRRKLQELLAPPAMALPKPVAIEPSKAIIHSPKAPTMMVPRVLRTQKSLTSFKACLEMLDSAAKQEEEKKEGKNEKTGINLS